MDGRMDGRKNKEIFLRSSEKLQMCLIFSQSFLAILMQRYDSIGAWLRFAVEKPKKGSNRRNEATNSRPSAQLLGAD
jgi:hypothetical protein